MRRLEGPPPQPGPLPTWFLHVSPRQSQVLFCACLPRPVHLCWTLRVATCVAFPSHFLLCLVPGRPPLALGCPEKGQILFLPAFAPGSPRMALLPSEGGRTGWVRVASPLRAADSVSPGWLGPSWKWRKEMTSHVTGLSPGLLTSVQADIGGRLGVQKLTWVGTSWPSQIAASGPSPGWPG